MPAVLVNRAYCYVELAVSSQAVAMIITSTQERMARLSWQGWLVKY